MKLYTLARKVNKRFKERRRENAGKYLSPVRRLERFSVTGGEKIVSMTFDDGPMNMPAHPTLEPKYEKWGLTKVLIDIMGEYGARGTFNVVGTKEYNYPDRQGTIHKPTWSGVKHDHYPQYGKDQYAGLRIKKNWLKHS